MRNLLLTISFLGSKYHGFQVQRNGLSVAQTLQDGIQQVLGRREPIKGCSRTDAGVHANRFYLSMKTEHPMDCGLLRKALDAVLPRDIAVTDCREVPLAFHARYDCTGKRYLYLIWNAPWMSPFYQGRAYHQRSRLDEKALHRAAQDFLGTHDFSAFCSAGGGREDRVRTIQAASVERQGELLTFSVTGDGFLYNMVRIMVGTLLDMGGGKLEPQAIPAIIASQDRRQAGRTAPPDGLYLDEVFYPPSVFEPDGEALTAGKRSDGFGTASPVDGRQADWID